MSISHSLANALSGLTAASRMTEVVSSNLANAMTDGYGRRQLLVSAETVGGRGAGVKIDGVQRIVDKGILADRRLADAEMGTGSSSTAMLGRLERLLGADGGTAGLSARLTALEAALVAAASDPASDVRLGLVGTRLTEVAQSFNAAADGVQALRADADADIGEQVDLLNLSLRQVEQLNADISFSRNSGQDPAGLMDERQRVIDRIAGIVPLREMERQGGQVALMTPAGQMLVDGPARQFGFARVGVVTPVMTLQSGALSGITLDGVPIDPLDGVGRLAGGSLGAAFALRDTGLVGTQTALDAMARNLVERFQDPATDPSLGATDAGLFTDAGARFNPADTEGLAARLAVNPAINPDQGGLLSRLRDGVMATTPGPAGAAAQLDRFRAALDAPRATHLGGAASSMAGHAAGFLSRIGADRLAAEDRQAFAGARWESLRQAELAGGVDTDHEMQMLLQIEQSYAANARLVQTLEQMIRTLMEI